MSAALQAEGLRWRVGTAEILAGIALEVEQGSVCGVLGPNGSGKTTLLRCLAMLLRPHDGTVSVEGADLAELGARERGRTLAVLVQEQPAELELTALDVVLIGRAPHKRRLEFDGAGDYEIAREALAAVRAEAFEGRSVATLSGGELQRVLIARVLAQRAPLLLLDEPTNHLDLRHQHELFAGLRSSELTVVASLHDPQFAATYCDRIVVLDRGRVAAVGDPQTTLTSRLLRQVWGVDADVREGVDGVVEILVRGAAAS